MLQTSRLEITAQNHIKKYINYKARSYIHASQVHFKWLNRTF